MNNYSNNTRSMNGLNNINANSGNFDEIDVNTLVINTSGTAPTRPNGDSTLNIANTQFVTNAVTTAGGSFVTLAGSQTLTTGIKTFTNLPQCSATPVNPTDLVTKAYADSGAFVTLNTNQTITGQKTFTDFNLFLNDNGINSNNGTLAFQDSSGDGALMYYNNDDTTGSGGLRIVSSKYGMAYSTTTGAGEHVDFLSQDINFRATDSCDFTQLAIPPPAGGQQNQVVRGSIYDNTVANLPNTTGITFTNGDVEDAGIIGTAMTVSVPAGNTRKVIRVAIPFDLFTYNYTNPSLSGAGNFALSYTGFSGLAILKNGVPYTPTVLEGAPQTAGTVTRTWTRTGTQTSIDGIASYMTTIYVTFSIDTYNTTTDNYQVRLIINGTINWGGWFGFGLFIFYKAGTLVGNSFTTTSYAVYSGGTMTNPTVTGYIDASVTAVASDYPVPPSTASFYFPLNNNITPPGMITMFAGSVAPRGWLLCSGALVNVVDYLNLFFVIGNLYGGSATQTGTVLGGTFALPNTKGIFVSGAGSQTIGVSNTYTRTLATTQGHNLENHQHTYSDAHYYDDATSGQPNGSTVAGCLSGSQYQTPGGDGTGMVADETFQNRLTKGTYLSTATQVNQATAPSTGSLTGTETYPANICFNYIIKW